MNNFFHRALDLNDSRKTLTILVLDPFPLSDFLFEIVQYSYECSPFPEIFSLKGNDSILEFLNVGGLWDLNLVFYAIA